MIYDRFDVEGICKGCAKATKYHINGDYPVCPNCIVDLIESSTNILNMLSKEKGKKVDFEFNIH